jgi:hypothetical protein
VSSAVTVTTEAGGPANAAPLVSESASIPQAAIGTGIIFALLAPYDQA